MVFSRAMQIQRNHELGREEVRRRIESAAEALTKKYGVRTEWKQDALKMSASGLDGQITYDDNQVTVVATLGFALKMLESTIQSAVEEALDEHLR